MEPVFRITLWLLKAGSEIHPADSFPPLWDFALPATSPVVAALLHFSGCLLGQSDRLLWGGPVATETGWRSRSHSRVLAVSQRLGLLQALAADAAVAVALSQHR
eukprot:7801709-Alexandrium_andersonii.AAC.1